jgi:hypothetical protein
MTPEEIKNLKVMFATFKFEIGEIVEQKIREILDEKQKPKKYVEVGYQ